MRLGLFGFIAAFCCASPAAMAQTTITLDASQGPPIVSAEINDRPVRFEVDLRLPDVLVLNPAAADLLRVQRVPFVAGRVSLDDASIRGRIARPRIEFGEAGAGRALTGVFNVPATDRADGVIGPGVLPHRVIRVLLGGTGAGRTITLPLENADVWETNVTLAGINVEAVFDVLSSRSTFNRSASAELDQIGAIVADGEHADTPMLLGLRALTQPVRTDLTVHGLPLSPAVARTRSPLEGALDQNTIVVTAGEEPTPPRLWIGRSALANCSSISVDRRARTLTLECAG